MPTDYDLQIDGKTYSLKWDRPTPPTQQEIEGIVTQYRQAAKQSPVTPSARPPAGGAATPPVSTTPDRKAIDKFRLDFFNTDNPNANVPKQTAVALAANPNDPEALSRLSKMSPVSQAAIREHAAEIEAENDRTQAYIHSFDKGLSAERIADSLHSIAGGGGFANPMQQQAYKAQQIPGFDPTAAFKGPEGARQNKMTGHGKLDPSLNVLADYAAFGATPEGAAFGEAMGVIGGLGAKAAKAVTGSAVALGEMDAAKRYMQGDKQGAATAAAVGLLPLALHGVAGKVRNNGKVTSPEVTPTTETKPSEGQHGAVDTRQSSAVQPKSSEVTSTTPEGVRIGKVTPKEGATPEQKQAIAAHNAQLEARRTFSLETPKPVQGVNNVHPLRDQKPVKTGQKAGNINLDYVDTQEEVKTHILEVAKENAAGIEKARGGTISNAETAKAAQEMGLTPEQLEKAAPGASAAHILALRDLHAKAAEESASAAKAARANPSEETSAFAEEKAQHFRAIQETLTGHTAEAGRALQIFKELAASRRANDYTQQGIAGKLQLAEPSVPLTPEEHAAAEYHAAEVEKADEAAKELQATHSRDEDELKSKAAGEQFIEQNKTKAQRSGRRSGLTDVQKLDEEHEQLKNKLIRAASQSNTLVDPKLLPIVRDIAANRVKRGAITLDALVKQVHATVSEHVPDLTERDIRDAISGYGYPVPISRATVYADLKEQARLLSQIEDEQNRVTKPARTPRPVSPAVKALRERLLEVRKMNRPVGASRGATAPRIRPVRPLPAKMTRLERLTQQFERIRKKNEAGEYGKLPPVPEPDTAEEAAMRHNLQTANRERTAMQKAQSPAQDYFKAAREKITKDIAELDRQIKAGEPDPHAGSVKRQYPTETQKLLDERAEKRQNLAELAAEARFKADRAVEARSTRGKLQRLRRFAVLSHITSLGHLTGAAVRRTLFTSPAESLIGAGLRRLPVISRIAAKAPHGTPTMEAQLRGWGKLGESKTYQSALQKLKTGANHLDLLHGDKKASEQEGLMGFAGRLHGATKTPTAIAEFEKSYRTQEAFYKRQGIDTTHPAIQATLLATAKAKSDEAILMQKNGFAEAFQNAVSGIERNTKNPVGRATAGAIRATIPIVKVPLNYVGEKALMTPGIGLLRAVPELKNGIDALTPEQADTVMKVFRKQGLGLAMAAVGWYGYNKIGGNYTPYAKRMRKGDTPEFGDVKTPLGTVSHTFLHSSDQGVVNMFADLHRAIDYENRRSHSLSEEAGTAAYSSIVGTANEVPFVDIMDRIAQSEESPGKLGAFTAGEAASMVTPGFLSDIGNMTDTDSQGRKRKRPLRGARDAVLQELGLRKLIPEGKSRR